MPSVMSEGCGRLGVVCEEPAERVCELPILNIGNARALVPIFWSTSMWSAW